MFVYISYILYILHVFSTYIYLNINFPAALTVLCTLCAFWNFVAIWALARALGLGPWPWPGPWAWALGGPGGPGPCGGPGLCMDMHGWRTSIYIYLSATVPEPARAPVE